MATNDLTLHEFLNREKDAIMTAWLTLGQQHIDRTRHISLKQQQNNIPDLLDAIAHRSTQADGNPGLGGLLLRVPLLHAEQRWNLGFSLEELTREYSLLRVAIMQRLAPRIGELGADELIFLQQTLDQGIIEGVTEYVARSNQQLGYLAAHDTLTGLPNRALFVDRLHQELAHAERDGLGRALLYLDLDFFKDVNSMLGHAGGDELLKQVAKRLEDALRRTDTVCRVSGDEFMILLSDVEMVEHVTDLAAKITEQFSSPFQIGNQVVTMSSSIGIAVYPGDGDDPQTLIKHADIAMYQAKVMGRNGVKFFTSGMNNHAEERRQLQSDLRNALSETRCLWSFSRR